MGKLSEILSLPLIAGSCEVASEYLTNYLGKIPNLVTSIDDSWNIVVTKGSAATAPCFITNMEGDKYTYNAQVRRIFKNTWVAYDSTTPSPAITSCGLASKVGMYISLCLLEALPNVKLIFMSHPFNHNFNLDLFNDCRWVCQLDAEGRSKIITQIMSTDLCDDAFEDDLLELGKPHGYTKQSGVRTTLGGLKEAGLNIAGCIISGGFFSPYSGFPQVREADLQVSVQFAKTLALELTDTYPHTRAGKCATFNCIDKALDFYCHRCLITFRQMRSKCVGCSNSLVSGRDFFSATCEVCREKS